MQRILVVEDEMQIARTLRDYLEVAGYEVTVVGDGGAALASARGERPDLVVLDLGLPTVVGLELGADDYLVKPFSPKELVARVRAVLRRTSGATAGAEILRIAGVEVDLPKRRARVEGRTVDLTPTEYQLLVTMLREPGRVFTRAQLQDALHGMAIESYDRAIDAHIKNLRRKIEPEVGHPRYVLTVHGVGYRFADD